MNMIHLASRLFGVPLLIERGKLDVILAALGPRLGVDTDPVIYGPGDTGKSRKDYYVTEDGIGVIDIVGPLVKRNSGGFLSGGPTTYGQIESEFMDAATDPLIKGILLQIDSPGGESLGAFELSDMIYGQRGSKPIYASVDGDAFSAAYALASAADRVILTKSGGVGSVGVWMMHVDQSAYNEQKGLKPTFLFAGARKIDGNPHEPLSKEAASVFQSEVDRIYGMFVDTVARNRKMDSKAVRATEAGLFFGQNGIDIDFADQLGTYGEALAALRGAISSPLVKAAEQRVLAAKAATSANPKRSNHMEGTQTADGGSAAAEQKTQEAPPPAARPPAVTDDGFARASQIVQLCALAGMTARTALKFLRPDASIETIRQEILDARAAAGEREEIHSHILPEAGTDAGSNPEDSPLVKEAQRRAQAVKGGR